MIMLNIAGEYGSVFWNPYSSGGLLKPCWAFCEFRKICSWFMLELSNKAGIYNITLVLWHNTWQEEMLSFKVERDEIIFWWEFLYFLYDRRNKWISDSESRHLVDFIRLRRDSTCTSNIHVQSDVQKHCFTLVLP